MGEIAGVFGVPHTPLLWRVLEGPSAPDLDAVAANFARFREMIAAARPDTVVVVASDHFRQLTTAAMPAFMIGKAPVMRGTHPNEERAFGLPARPVPGDPGLASAILGHHELTERFDFSFSDEPWLDHSFMVPLLYLVPDLIIPVVPVFTNGTAPPLPRAARFAELGRYLRQAIEGAAVDKRVVVVGSGHLALELGGPRQFLGTSPDPGFDAEAMGWMARGDIDRAVAVCSFDRLTAAGNLTHQFLNLVTCLGVAGEGAAIAEATPTRFGNEPFVAWGPA